MRAHFVRWFVGLSIISDMSFHFSDACLQASALFWWFYIWFICYSLQIYSKKFWNTLPGPDSLWIHCKCDMYHSLRLKQIFKFTHHHLRASRDHSYWNYFPNLAGIVFCGWTWIYEQHTDGQHIKEETTLRKKNSIIKSRRIQHMLCADFYKMRKLYFLFTICCVPVVSWTVMQNLEKEDTRSNKVEIMHPKPGYHGWRRKGLRYDGIILHMNCLSKPNHSKYVAMH